MLPLEKVDSKKERFRSMLERLRLWFHDMHAAASMPILWFVLCFYRENVQGLDRLCSREQLAQQIELLASTKSRLAAQTTKAMCVARRYQFAFVATTLIFVWPAIVVFSALEITFHHPPHPDGRCLQRVATILALQQRRHQTEENPCRLEGCYGKFRRLILEKYWYVCATSPVFTGNNSNALQFSKKKPRSQFHYRNKADRPIHSPRSTSSAGSVDDNTLLRPKSVPVTLTLSPQKPVLAGVSIDDALDRLDKIAYLIHICTHIMRGASCYLAWCTLWRADWTDFFLFHLQFGCQTLFGTIGS